MAQPPPYGQGGGMLPQGARMPMGGPNNPNRGGMVMNQGASPGAAYMGGRMPQQQGNRMPMQQGNPGWLSYCSCWCLITIIYIYIYIYIYVLQYA